MDGWIEFERDLYRVVSLDHLSQKATISHSETGKNIEVPFSKLSPVKGFMIGPMISRKCRSLKILKQLRRNNGSS